MIALMTSLSLELGRKSMSKFGKNTPSYTPLLCRRLDKDPTLDQKPRQQVLYLVISQVLGVSFSHVQGAQISF